MNRSLLIALAAATLVALGLVVLLDRNPSVEAPSGGAVVPGLGAQVNDVDAVDLVAPGGAISVQLRRENERWRVADRDGYEADFRQVVDLLRALAEAERAEPRTANPERYGRLGVAAVGDEEATGRRIDFPGTALPSLIVGQVDPTGEGSYVRLASEEQAWLADRVIEAAVDPVAWLEPSIMDIPGEDLREVTVTHPDGETVRLQKADGDWVLRDVPEGRSAGPAWARDALGNGLRGLNLDDVRRFAPPYPDEAVRTVLETEDGLVFTAQTWREGDGDDAPAWIHFTVAGRSVPASSSTEAEETEPDSDASGDGPQQDTDPAERLADVVAVDARLSPWAFRIPAARADDLAPRLEDLLAPIDDATD